MNTPETTSKMKPLVIGTAVVGIAALVAIWGAWNWMFCRFYVGPGEMAVIVAKIGKDLPPGEILAHTGQRGVQEEVLAEGRHFLNPVFYDWRIEAITVIETGKIGVVTAKVGKDLAPGEFLAEPGQKGIWRRVLGPGKYRLNPVGYEVKQVDAISVPVGYVGAITSLSGTQAPIGKFAKAGQKGVREEILQPGLYYVNPYEFKIDVVEVGVNQVTLSGKQGAGVITKTQIATTNSAVSQLEHNVLARQQAERQEYFDAEKAASGSANSGFRELRPSAPSTPSTAKAKMPTSTQAPGQAAFVLNQPVEFPSKDGFEIVLDMTVEFELLPENIAWVFRTYGDLPAAVDKVIMPQILSVSRLKGSAYGARDFIVGEGREQFQKDLTETLARVLGEKKIVVHNALIRHVNVPPQILDPIQAASIAQETDLTNQEKQNTAKKQADLNTETSLIDQAGQQVAQETEKLKAEIKATQGKLVAELGAETLRQVAEIEKNTAAARAEKTTTLGKAQAEVIRMVEGEKAAGFQLKVKAYGDPVAYNLWTFANGLSPDMKINILHSGPGTLWTDLQKAGLGDLGGARLLQSAPKR